MPSLAKPAVCIVTPGTADANNGNWRTADRWARMLRPRYRVILQTEWRGERCDALIALHARRSAASVAGIRAEAAATPVAVVLTGTDLYRDLPASVEAVHSLDLADRIVVLQEEALRALPGKWAAKAEVIYQSAPVLRPRRKATGRLDCVAVGHLRDEKDPLTLLAALGHLDPSLPIRIRHVGAPLDASIARAARRTQRDDPRYRYLGALPHGLARAAIARAHLLVHPSRMEGGANVVVEAVTAGTAVVASRIAGNVGMLGADYPGYFEAGNASDLAHRLVQALMEPGNLRRLGAACASRRGLFRPQAEAARIRALVARLTA